MPHTVWAVVRSGHIELKEPLSMSDGTPVLVTFLPEEDEARFWSNASLPALAGIWDNNEDDVYAQLLET